MTLVSVIVPAFNAQETLERTLHSIINQTHVDLEVFVVDDGSIDRTLDLARTFPASDSRLRILTQKNGGVASARNAALAVAKGKYVAWLDADDLWHPTKISKQLDVFDQAAIPPSFVYTGYRLIDHEDRVLPNLRPLTDVSGHTVCQQIATNFFSNVSSIMVPLQLARHLGGHDPRLRAWGMEGAEDLLLQLRLSLIGPVGCCKEALVGYRMHDLNMSNEHERASRSNLKALELIQSEADNIPDWVFRMGRARVVGYSAHMLRHGRVLPAVRLLAQLTLDQPAETLMMLRLIAGKVFTDIVLGKQNTDPEAGELFMGTDPGSEPWEDHMLLTNSQKERLATADQQRESQLPTALGHCPQSVAGR